LTFPGRTYRQALELARLEGVAVHRIIVTAPPRAVAGRGELRVLAERRDGHRITLILAYEDYQRNRHPVEGERTGFPPFQREMRC
jgi:hypothetical protein